MSCIGWMMSQRVFHVSHVELLQKIGNHSKYENKYKRAHVNSSNICKFPKKHFATVLHLFWFP